MRKRFEMRYELVILYDSGRELSIVSYSATEAESVAKQWIEREGVRRVDVFRTEHFFFRKFFPTERNS